MNEEFNKLLKEAEIQHEKLIILYAQVNEQISKIQLEKEKVMHLLSNSKGVIEGYRKVAEIMNKCDK